MATSKKKGKKKAAKKKAAKKVSKKVTAKKKSAAAKAAKAETITEFVRGRKAAGDDEETILKKALAKFPDKKPTMGYVRWIDKHSRTSA